MRNYSLSGQAEGSPGTISTTLPIFSTDTGMTFERSSKWFGRDYTQTLEPRLFYLNIPYRDQSKIPLFDTGLADFNFAQIFSENQFSSWDRINNANQLTAAATTRLLEPNTGSEIMRAMVGQRFYLSKNQVSLVNTSTALPDDRKSDFLAAFSGQVLPRLYADFASQYSVADKQMKRYSMGLRYLPEPGKVLNAAYRYNRDETSPVDQIDLSGQWPIAGRWYGVGRWNYSFRVEGSTLTTTSLGTTLSSTPQSGRVIQSLAGLEYNGGCWVVRGVLQKLALTQDSSSTGFFLQLELSDFASIGSNPINMLRRNIQGYSLINQPVADPVFGQ
jgi:LPS-assembly protein